MLATASMISDVRAIGSLLESRLQLAVRGDMRTFVGWFAELLSDLAGSPWRGVDPELVRQAVARLRCIERRNEDVAVEDGEVAAQGPFLGAWEPLGDSGDADDDPLSGGLEGNKASCSGQAGQARRDDCRERVSVGRLARAEVAGRNVVRVS